MGMTKSYRSAKHGHVSKQHTPQEAFGKKYEVFKL